MGKARLGSQNVRTYQPPPETLAHFHALPWCRPTLYDPDFRPYDMSRTVSDNGLGHTLMGKTWNTDDTVREVLSFYKAPTSTSRGEIRRFYTFGNGLNAHPSFLHGGVIATILDSTLGNVIKQGREDKIQGPAYTAQLNVAYKSPVKTPGTIMSQGWIKSIEAGGRKIWVEGVVSSEVDGKVVIHANVESLWLVGKSKL
ncbi:gb [Venturia nashicola]|uniref:Gb n=1 Tax=Venturia nashicola TaxID=86259 RepID=A0A4Z1PIU6_9PEZI|nr:gb [Venturia nashicola]